MSFVDDVMTGGVGSIVKGVTDLASDLITTDKERLAAEIQLKDLDVKEQGLYLGDIDSARKLQEKALSQEDVFSKRFVYFFSMAWSGFAMLFMGFVTLSDIPKDNINNVNIILGFLLGTAVSSIFNFFLGTSRSSQAKDATISALSSNK